jgi:L-alanine-DL-glutamate epimerase-like enolase superfamily enzyme
MIITDVEALHLRLPSIEEIADGTQDVLVIRIHTDAGLVGIGEVSSQSYVCKAIFEAPRSAERRHGLAYLLRGQNPLDVEGLWQRLYYHTNRYGRRGAVIHAISGAGLALWDLTRSMYCSMASSAEVPLIAFQASNFAPDKVEAARPLARRVTFGRLFIKSVQFQHRVIVRAFSQAIHVLLSFCKSNL